MGIYAIKPAFQRQLVHARDGLVRAGVSADAITWSAVILSVAGGAAIAVSPVAPLLFLVVPVLALGRITLNALDGMVAAASGTARAFGEVLNEFCDRLSDAAWFAGLAFVVDPRLALGALVMILVSSYVGTASKAAGGPRLYSGVMAKADRMILLALAAPIAAGAGHRVLVAFVWLAGAGAAVTTAQRLILARRSLAGR